MVNILLNLVVISIYFFVIMCPICICIDVNRTLLKRRKIEKEVEEAMDKKFKD